MAKRNILQESIVDANQIKEAAYLNAQNVIMEHMKDNVKRLVDDQLNESFQNETDEVNEAASCDDDEEVTEEGYNMTEGEEDMAYEDELDLDEMPEEDEEVEGEEEEEEEMSEGLSEADLEEAINAALSEVTHGGLGDMEFVENDGDKQPTGIEDLDSKEDGWEVKTPPKSKPAQIHTGEQYHQENYKLKAKVAHLVKENIMLKKAHAKLSEALGETKLFNSKLYYASKLMQNESLNKEMKKSVIKKMDNATTHNEAKSIYESVEFAIGLVGESKKASRPKNSLSEALGSESKSAGTGAGVSNTPLNESYVYRNKVLAGIVKE